MANEDSLPLLTEVACRRAIRIDVAVRVRVIVGFDIAIRIGVSVQARNIAVEVGRILTNFIQNNPIFLAKPLKQFCHNTSFVYYD